MGLKGFLLFLSLVKSGQAIHLLYSCLEKVSNLGKRRFEGWSPKGESWSISYVYSLGTHFPLVVRTNSQSTTKLLPFLLADPWHEGTDLYPWRQGWANKKDFFFSSSCLFLVRKKGKNLSKINVRNSSSVSIGCLIFFHICFSIMLPYLPLSWGWCFFWGENLPFLDKEIGNY